MNYAILLENYLITDTTVLEGFGSKIKEGLKWLFKKAMELFRKFKQWMINTLSNISFPMLLKKFEAQLRAKSKDKKTLYYKNDNAGAALHRMIFNANRTLLEVTNNTMFKLGFDLVEAFENLISEYTNPERYTKLLFDYIPKMSLSDSRITIMNQLPKIRDAINNGYSATVDDIISSEDFKHDFERGSELYPNEIEDLVGSIKNDGKNAGRYYAYLRATANKILAALKELNSRFETLEFQLKVKNLSPEMENAMYQYISETVEFANKTTDFQLISFKHFKKSYLNSIHVYMEIALRYGQASDESESDENVD